ncbi:MAG: bifunctional DNA-formamidopyrimidine glycosylase/DNA-(apurinic or apyrimidinic site) lyase, partial [Rubrivivax sp.]|nr:bifunctional DNA-formamidopyrimidine glycosylase/DNA-(apurinic or apyrimidinic site) lyase [Pyrinomonadaceae bacterium]
VELVARALDRTLRGQRIASARLLRARLAPDNTPRQFARSLRGARVEEVGRRGKFIVVRFDSGQVLLTHLRMTGNFSLLHARQPLPKHTHALFQLEDGRRLAFTDQRHFGLMKIARASELEQTKELRGLAPEPFSDDFTPDYLAGVLAATRRVLKSVLLDQTKVTGLGNIYAAEALFLARVNPFITASELSRRRVLRLHHAIQDVLGEALAYVRARDVDLDNIEGNYFSGSERGWRVYDREGELCRDCAAPVRRIAHAGRSTYFCPRCQKR